MKKSDLKTTAITFWNNLSPEQRLKVKQAVENFAKNAAIAIICGILQTQTGFPFALCSIIAEILYTLIKNRDL